MLISFKTTTYIKGRASMTEFRKLPFGKEWVVCIGAIHLNLRGRQRGRMWVFLEL